MLVKGGALRDPEETHSKGGSMADACGPDSFLVKATSRCDSIIPETRLFGGSERYIFFL